MMLTMAGSATRQERFRRMLAAEGLDAAVITDGKEIYYLTGLPPDWRCPSALYIERDGRSWLITHTEDGEALVDDRVVYQPHIGFTTNPDLLRIVAAKLGACLAGASSPKAIGWQQESLQRLIGEVVGEKVNPGRWVPIDDQIALMEKRKDPDEIALLRKAAACALAAYDADRAAIAPGVTELEVLEAGHRAATLEGGEVVYHNGDYRSGELGGFARNRAIQAGELYIIDAWVTYRGYWADLCRTFAVSEPTKLQQEVFDLIVDIHRELPGRLQPGSRGSDLAAWIDGRLREHPYLRDRGLTHHAGHGTGLRGHEAPDLNAAREGIIEVGDVLCVEPGAYGPELNAGIRLENTWVVTETGVDLLSPYPFQLGK